MFKYAYWCSEVKEFKAIFAKVSLSDETYVGALKGLSILVGLTSTEDPEHQVDVLQEFRDCFALARRVKGRAWMKAHAQVFASHGSPLPP